MQGSRLHMHAVFISTRSFSVYHLNRDLIINNITEVKSLAITLCQAGARSQRKIF